MKFKILVILLAVILGGGYFLFKITNKSEDNANLYNTATVTSGDNPQSGSLVHDLPIEPAALVVRKDLAIRLGVDEKKIIILEIKDQLWGNGCLGLEQAGEMCSMALVPGFRVLSAVDGKEYVYRTNKDGTVFRAEPGVTKTGEVIR